MQFGIGIRVVAFISFVLGVALLGVCGWTYDAFIKGKIGHNSTLVELKQEEQKAVAPAPLTTSITTVSETYSKLGQEWDSFKPFLMGSGGLALASGIVQVLTALLLLCSGTKGARNRVGCFKMTHFLVAVALMVALIVPAVFDMAHDSWSHKLKDVFHQIKTELHKSVDQREFSPDVVTAYYIVIATDVAGIIAIILSTCCLMRNAEYDYREYP